MRRLTYGRTYNKRVFDALLWFRFYRATIEHYEKSGDVRRRKLVDKHTDEFIDRLRKEMVNALCEFKPDWFQTMADAIKAVRAVSKNGEIHPLHLELLDLDQNSYTITEICGLLKKRGHYTQMDNNPLQVMVRRACDQIGFAYLRGKPGQKHKKS